MGRSVCAPDVSGERACYDLRMSYSHSLGAGLPAPLLSASNAVSSKNAALSVSPKAVAAPASTDPFQIVPPECSRMRPIGTSIYPTIAAGQIAMFTWPYVTLDDVQVRSALDAIVGNGSQGGGPAVLAGLVSAVSSAVVATSTAQTGQVTSDAVRARAVALAPTFLAAGFIRDAEVNQSVTRGYLWISASWAASQNVNEAKRIVTSILRSALPPDTLWTGATLPSGKVKTLSGLVTAAANESDVALEAAAKESVVSFVEAASALASVVATVLGGRTVSSAAVAMRNEFSTSSERMRKAALAIQSATSLVGQVEAVAAAAMALPAEAQNTAGLALQEMQQRLRESKSWITDGMQNARSVLETCAQETDGTGGIARRLRDLVYEDARATIDRRGVPTVAREYAKCQLWKRAQQQLDNELRGLAADLSGACAVAGGLIQNGNSLEALIATVDAALARLDFVISQLRMNWWSRDYMGVPVGYWIGGASAIALVGGGLVIRSIKRRKASASLAPVSKNKRRSR